MFRYTHKKREGPRVCTRRPSKVRQPQGLVLGLTDVLRLQSLRSLGDVELHPLSFRERAEAVHLDGSVVDEDVLAALLRDEPETLAVVEPLDSTLRHCSTFLLADGRAIRVQTNR